VRPLEALSFQQYNPSLIHRRRRPAITFWRRRQYLLTLGRNLRAKAVNPLRIMRDHHLPYFAVRRISRELHGIGHKQLRRVNSKFVECLQCRRLRESTRTPSVVVVD
jgi:hypothetical protein